MANKKLFSSSRGRMLPRTDVLNEAGGNAYAFGPEHALAQLASTGCLNATHYASADEQLDAVLGLATKVAPLFLAKTAVYARERGLMKDLPALLLAVLSHRDPALFAKVFGRVVDNPKMLRTFVQIMRSGQAGRKSLETRPKKMILGWLSAQSDEGLFRGSVGESPSMGDVIKMVHPKPASPSRRALYAYLVGKAHEAAELPGLVQSYEAFKAAAATDPGAAVPDVPFQMLTALPLDGARWAQIARDASWQTVRMNLNTFARHGVFEVPGMTESIAGKLRDRASIRRARVLPYQLLVAFTAASRSGGVPRAVVDALQDAMEVATENVPELPGKVWVLVDVSGSMSSPVTGHRKGSTTTVRCVDAAALIAAAILRRNPAAEILGWDDRVHPLSLNSRDSVMTNAARLAAIGGGGTNMSGAIAHVAKGKIPIDMVIVISDNQSWIDGRNVGPSSASLAEWERIKHKSADAKLVCIDLAPYTHTQAPDREDILNVGGFSDQVFDVLRAFGEAGLDESHWVAVIERMEI